MAKLTLSIKDKSLVNEAKKYATLHNTSISGLVSEYLKNITTKSKPRYIHPVVKELIGKKKFNVTDKELRDEYHKHLEDKYL
jgi:hypothetical protein